MAPSNISLSHVDSLRKDKRDSAPLEPGGTTTDAAIKERKQKYQLYMDKLTVSKYIPSEILPRAASSHKPFVPPYPAKPQIARSFAADQGDLFGKEEKEKLISDMRKKSFVWVAKEAQLKELCGEKYVPAARDD